jgi:hypothetical protein
MFAVQAWSGVPLEQVVNLVPSKPTWRVWTKLSSAYLGTVDSDITDAYSLLRDLQEQVANKLKLRHPTRLTRYLAFWANDVLLTPKEWTFRNTIPVQDKAGFLKALMSTKDLCVMYDEDDRQELSELVGYGAKNPYDDSFLCVILPDREDKTANLDMRLIAFNTDQRVTKLDLIRGLDCYVIHNLDALVGFASLERLYLQNVAPSTFDFLHFLPNLTELKFRSTKDVGNYLDFVRLNKVLAELGRSIKLVLCSVVFGDSLCQAGHIELDGCKFSRSMQSFGECSVLYAYGCAGLFVTPSLFTSEVKSIVIRASNFDLNCLVPNVIPHEVGLATNLVTLNLDHNNLVGSIPTEVGQLTNLTKLCLMRNKLTNTIPTEIGNLLNLTVLDLFNNVLTGVLPHHLGRLTKLQHLDVSRNKLTGVVPSEITKLGLTYFQLNGNLWQPI